MSMKDFTDARGAQRNRPANVDALASTVISVLRGRQGASSEGLRQFVLDHMMRAILAKGAFAVDGLMCELRGYRLTTDAVIDLYVPNVARMLGEYWVDDRINFAEVTIGIMRLQALLTEAVAFQIAAVPLDTALHALVVVPQGEQHFFGANVLASQIRRMGHEVDISFDEDMGSLTARLMRDVPDAILISCARRETLEAVTKTVQIIRKVAPRGPLLAVGGAVKMRDEDIIAKTGVDMVTNMADEVMSACAKRAAQPGTR